MEFSGGQNGLKRGLNGQQNMDARRVSLHQIGSTGPKQPSPSPIRSQLQTREDLNYRKINSQGLMQPTYAGLEQYNT